MKKLLLKTFFVFSFLLSSAIAKAQWVPIPDANFVMWLNNNGYAGCMNGNLMDTTCSAIINTVNINCSSQNITDLTGLQYFVNLLQLTCSDNNLTFLPPLPTNLNYLECSDNQLTSLPNLPSSIWLLSCYDNALTSLPNLPSSLAFLYCLYNGLLTLPSLPSSLALLNCYENQLVSLPAIPSSVIEIYCDHNGLTALPNLPPTLQILSCNYNLINYLPSLPQSLLTLNCSNNQLYSLPNLPDSLQNLDCGYNQLIVFPNLPTSLQTLVYEFNNISIWPIFSNSLQYINCDANNISSIPSLPSNLQIFHCSMNQLISLPNLPLTIESLECDNNDLTSLPILPDSIHYVRCTANQLTTIPNFPTKLYYIMCYQNPINYLPDLPDSVNWLDIHQTNLNCFPKFRHIDNLQWSSNITCLPNAGYIGFANPPINNFPICQPASGCNFYWNIYGRTFNELNTNCTKDSNELYMRNIPAKLYSGINLLQEFITNNEGYYSFQTGLGNYTVKIDTTGLPFDVICPVSTIYNSNLTAIDSLDADLDFGLQCKPGYLDLEAKSIASSATLRAGSQRTLYLRAGDATLFYGITCATGVSGTVEAVLNNLVSYVSPYGSAFTPSSINGDTLTWSIPDFATVDPLTAFNVIVQVDSNAAIGYTACFQLNIYPFADNNPANNSLTHCFPIVNSVDPNAKEIYPGGLVDTTQHDFTFTIYFQNTGTASADNIYILDTLDNDLDAATFQFLSSSHNPVTQLLPGNILRFSFPHINLPDSVSDEPASHGYVQYKISRKNIYYPGMIITNHAHIYFDFNAPVATNEVIAFFPNNLGVSQQYPVTFNIYPNPVTEGQFKISYLLPQDGIAIFEMFDVIGRKVYSQELSGKSTFQPITLPKIADGLYNCVITSGRERLSKKIALVSH